MFAGMKMSSSSDVIIVGGGPAGLAAGIALRRRGARCTVVDFRRPPIDKACGEGLMPDSLSVLSELGVELPPGVGTLFRGIRFNYGSISVAGIFPTGVGIGMRRTALHEVLHEHAVDSGVQFVWDAKVALIDKHKLSINNVVISFDWLIGADGQNSHVRKWTGLDRGEKVSIRYGFRRHFKCSPWSDLVEVYWAKQGQMFVGPVANDEMCVAFLTSDHQLKLDQALPFFPELMERLKGVSHATTMMGAVTATRTLHRAADGNVALIGDASGSVDAVTGEGMALSFRQAIALANAIANADLSSYVVQQKEIARLPMHMAKLMLLLDRFPSIQKRVISTLSDTPDTFAKLLSAHVGHQSLGITLATEAPRLLWNLAFSD